jgi:hypothetical protein
MSLDRSPRTECTPLLRCAHGVRAYWGAKKNFGRGEYPVPCPSSSRLGKSARTTTLTSSRRDSPKYLG